jgi:hypothetical protein
MLHFSSLPNPTEIQSFLCSCLAFCGVHLLIFEDHFICSLRIVSEETIREFKADILGFEKNEVCRLVDLHMNRPTFWVDTFN